MKKKAFLKITLVVTVIFTIVLSICIFTGFSLKQRFVIYAIKRQQGNPLRYAMAEILMKNADTVFFEPLLELTNDKDRLVARVSSEIVKYNTRNLSNEQKRVLKKYLHDGVPLQRETAAYIFGRIRDTSAVDDLIKALDDRDMDVREQVIIALIKIGDKKAVEVLIPVLKDKNPSIRRQVCAALGEMRDDIAIEPLINALSDPDDKVRFSAMLSLSKYSSDKVVKELLKAAKDKKRKFRYIAIDTLGKIRPPEAVEPIIAILIDPGSDRATILSAVKALGELRSVKASPVLAENLDNKDMEIRAESVKALGMTGSRGYSRVLLKMLDCSDDRVRAAVIFALGESLDKSAVPPIINLLKDTSPDVRVNSARALGNLGDGRAVEPLTEFLENPPQPLTSAEMVAAADSLGNLRDSRGIKSLVKLLKNRDQFVRNAAIIALKKIGDPAAIEPLRRVPDYVDAEVQEYVDEQEKQRGKMSKEDREIYAKYARDIRRGQKESAEQAIIEIEAGQRKGGE